MGRPFLYSMELHDIIRKIILIAVFWDFVLNFVLLACSLDQLIEKVGRTWKKKDFIFYAAFQSISSVHCVSWHCVSWADRCVPTFLMSKPVLASSPDSWFGEHCLKVVSLYHPRADLVFPVPTIVCQNTVPVANVDTAWKDKAIQMLSLLLLSVKQLNNPWLFLFRYCGLSPSTLNQLLFSLNFLWSAKPGKQRPSLLTIFSSWVCTVPCT